MVPAYSQNPLGHENNQKFNLLYVEDQFYFLGVLIGTRSGYGYTSRAGAMATRVNIFIAIHPFLCHHCHNLRHFTLFDPFEEHTDRFWKLLRVAKREKVMSSTFVVAAAHPTTTNKTESSLILEGAKGAAAGSAALSLSLFLTSSSTTGKESAATNQSQSMTTQTKKTLTTLTNG